ncbi:g695 [Coccomyxa elongata]
MVSHAGDEPELRQCSEATTQLTKKQLRRIQKRASNRESARRSREQKAQERERLIAENMDLTSQNKILSLEADELREQLRKARKEEIGKGFHGSVVSKPDERDGPVSVVH